MKGNHIRRYFYQSALPLARIPLPLPLAPAAPVEAVAQLPDKPPAASLRKLSSSPSSASVAVRFRVELSEVSRKERLERSAVRSGEVTNAGAALAPLRENKQLP